MKQTKTALENLFAKVNDEKKPYFKPFSEFLELVKENPEHAIRDIYLLVHDSVHHYVPEGVDEYPDDPESISFVKYDFSKLFVEGCDQPFFADRLFGNRFMNMINGFSKGTKKKYLFLWEGPPGCGKSTFLNNLLNKIEDYSSLSEGSIYETVWKLDIKKIAGDSQQEFREWFGPAPGQQDRHRRGNGQEAEMPFRERTSFRMPKDYLTVPCPNHDHPILQVPKAYRKKFLEEMITDDDFKERLFNEKQYDWVFYRQPCTLCTSLYKAILEKTGSPEQVFKMIHARQHIFSRQLGDGISVFNPGDTEPRQPVSNSVLQHMLNILFLDNPHIDYTYSGMAKTNNGIYVLMDIKGRNAERLTRLHNVLSESVHKVEYYEESVKSVFFALSNPQDKKKYSNDKAFLDRISFDNLNYVLDYNTEVMILKNIFGNNVDNLLLPGVIEDFAKVIISTRLDKANKEVRKWIAYPEKYENFVDPDLFLLKMDIYTGLIPYWLDEDDRKAFTSSRRRRIINSSRKEGRTGISVRKSKELFEKFVSIYHKNDHLITAENLYDFFNKRQNRLCRDIPPDFLEFLVQSYDNNVREQVKDSLFDFNESEVSRLIQNYMFAVNWPKGSIERCPFTGDRLEINDIFFSKVEDILLGKSRNVFSREMFREDTSREYSSRSLAVEISIDRKGITETELYRGLYSTYTKNLKDDVLEQFAYNENFRNAIKNYGEKEFRNYDRKIRGAVELMIKNLQKKYGYTKKGAQQISIYVYEDLYPKLPGNVVVKRGK